MLRDGAGRAATDGARLAMAFDVRGTATDRCARAAGAVGALAAGAGRACGAAVLPLLSGCSAATDTMPTIKAIVVVRIAETYVRTLMTCS